MGALPSNSFENTSNPVDAGADQNRESSTLASSLWQELGSKLSSYLKAETQAADAADARSLDFGVDDIYGGRSSDTAGNPSDQARSTGEASRFVPSDRPDARANYSGAVILRDVEPAEYTAEQDDTLQKIAQTHLGPGATKAEIKAHVREIAEVNGITKNASIDKGDHLDLPGHTLDGGYVTVSYNGDKGTSWRDGRELMERSNGTGYERMPDGGSGYSKIHWGPESTDNYEVVRTADGRYQVADNTSDSAVEPDSHDDLRVERERLSDLAESMSDSADQFRTFQRDMTHFETRAARDEVSSEEVAQT